MSIDNFDNVINEYEANAEKMIRRAYEYANYLHEGQVRQSGDAYITHPLTVAYILACMHADRDTICAALLHDTLEDTDITKDQIEKVFNREIAKLVDGVTKISKMNFSTKCEQNLANTRKIIISIMEDVRIIMIKLVDRLHNMRTLQYKSEFKQKENSLETLEIFVPLAYYIGAYQLKNELEDLAFKYLKPDIYNEIEERRNIINNDSKDCVLEMITTINDILDKNEISHAIRTRIKNIYGIYKRIVNKYNIDNVNDLKKLNLDDIHDLIAIKIMVNSVSECYQTLGIIHDKYHPINNRFKDYICNPKTNKYSSLHTTLFGPNERLIQTQIRTFDMDEIATYGLIAYWKNKKGNARLDMQEDLRNKYQFFTSLSEIDKAFDDNSEFVNQIKNELFSDRIYVYTTKGIAIELPKGATVIDFAYKLGTDIGDTMVGAIVNEQAVPVDYILRNKDRVKVVTDSLADSYKGDWDNKVKTTCAKMKILKSNCNVR